MKLASETTAGLWVPLVPSLDALLARLESLSLEPGFAGQAQIALRLALQPYRESRAGALMSPLQQETELANLLLYADFYPQDGQLTLIEQLRDDAGRCALHRPVIEEGPLRSPAVRSWKTVMRRHSVANADVG